MKTKMKITSRMVAAVLPHLRNAVEANARRWGAERRIELAIAKGIGEKSVEIDRISDHYADLCVMLNAPITAQTVVTSEHCRAFLESIEGAL